MNTENLSFEQALSRLEEIVGLLDSGSAPLDKSLELFEEGAALVRVCSQKLDNVEQRVKILTLKADGTAEESDMAPMGE